MFFISSLSSFLVVVFFVAIKVSGQATFSEVKSGTCGSVSGRAIIPDTAMCDLAAANLGLSGTAAHEMSESTVYPTGCFSDFSKTNSYYNTNAVTTGVCSSSRPCLCLIAPDCANTDGTALNDATCICGSVGCSTSTGLYCYESVNQCSLGPYYFSEVTSEMCSSVTGRGTILDKAMCGEAAKSVGWSATTAGEQSSKYSPAECYSSSSGRYLFLNTNTASTNSCSNSNPCLCLTAPDCTNTDGTTPNDATCLCGSVGCSTSTGLRCTQSVNTCHTPPPCIQTDGSTANNEACQCGTSSCSTTTGLHCYASDNFCTGPPCTITDGSEANTAELCKCGDVSCDAESGFICFTTKGVGSCRKENPGRFGYVEVNSGKCDSVSGRVSISDKAQCGEAARSVGWSETTAGKLSNKNSPAECYSSSSGQDLYLNTNTASTVSCSSSLCLCLTAPDCTNTDGTALNDATCICGSVGCTRSTGLLCNIDNSLQGSCSYSTRSCNQDGLTKNSKVCHCGPISSGMDCNTHDGMYCAFASCTRSAVVMDNLVSGYQISIEMTATATQNVNNYCSPLSGSKISTKQKCEAAAAVLALLPATLVEDYEEDDEGQMLAGCSYCGSGCSNTEWNKGLWLNGVGADAGEEWGTGSGVKGICSYQLDNLCSKADGTDPAITADDSLTTLPCLCAPSDANSEGVACTSQQPYCLSISSTEKACRAPCQAGTFRSTKTLNPDCETCNTPGYYCPQGGTTSPTQFPCQPGEYSDELGVAACKHCPVGQFNLKKAMTVCLACPAGQFQDNDKSTECKSCDPGTFQNATDGASLCRKCARGQHQKEPGKPYCLPCIPGKYQPNQAQDTCADCSTDTYSVDAEQIKCQDCDSGQYSSEGGKTFCEKCRAGYQIAGELGSLTCVKCTGGQFNPAPGGTCRNCSSGTYSHVDNTKCVSCEAGRWSSVEKLSDQSGCQNCIQGKYSSATGVTSSNLCNDCSPGKVSNEKGNDAEKNCHPCTEGTYMDEAGKQQCKNCTSAETSKKGATICTKCDAGLFLSSIDSSSSSTRKICRGCPEGYISTYGLDQCIMCGAGSYSNGSNQTNCISCEAGKHGTSSSQSFETTACGNCMHGKYSSATGLADHSGCVPCQPGKYSTEEAGKDANTCQPCPQGYLQSEPGKAKCEAVADGVVVAKGGSVAVTVPVGSRICTSVEEPSCDCQACVPFEACIEGTKGTAPPTTSCLTCLAGFSSVNASISCPACDKGRYNPIDGGLCKECPVNTFQDQSQKASLICKSCPSGYNQLKEGESMCIRLNWKLPADCKSGEQFLNDTLVKHAEWTCQPCPDGADCSGHVRWHQVVPKKNYRQMSYDNQTFGECLKRNACNGSTFCTDGHSGELCSQCLPKYAASSRSSSCEKCEDASSVGFAFAGTIVISLCLFGYLVYDNLDGARLMILSENDTSSSSTSMPFHTVAVRIVSSYFQISGMLLQFNMTLPKSVQVLVEVESGASTLGERLLMFECLTDMRDDFQLFMVRELSMVWFIPLISVCLCAVFWFVFFRRKWSVDGFVSSVMILFYTFFPSVVTRIALTLSCQDFGNRSLLSEALSVQCWKSKHWEAVMFVGLPGLILYVVLVPTGLAQKLIRLRRKGTLYVHQERYDPKWTLQYGFVFAGYREGYEWWESTIMLRKCCFVVLSIFLRRYGMTPQVVAASMVLSAALSLQLQYHPFVDDDHNFLESIGLHACLVQLLVALLSNTVGKIDDSTLGEVSTAVLVLTMFGSSLFFFGWTTRLTIQSSQETEGVVGMVAKACSSRCGTKENAQTEEPRISQSVVVPRPHVAASPVPAATGELHLIAGYKLQHNVRALMKQRLGQNPSNVVANTTLTTTTKRSLSRGKSVRTLKVEAIQKQHKQHRKSHMKKIKKQQTQRRSSVQARVAARKKAKQSNALVQCPIFSDLTATSIAMIIDKMEYEIVDEGVQICVQGDVADMFYLIMSGSCNVLFNGESVATLTELQVFGESALFPNGVGSCVAIRGATVETVRGGGNVQLLRLSKKKFDALLASDTLTKECVKKIEVVAKQRESANRLKMKTASSSSGAEV